MQAYLFVRKRLVELLDQKNPAQISSSVEKLKAQIRSRNSKSLQAPASPWLPRYPAGSLFQSADGFEWWGWGAGESEPVGSGTRRGSSLNACLNRF